MQCGVEVANSPKQRSISNLDLGGGNVLCVLLLEYDALKPWCVHHGKLNGVPEQHTSQGGAPQDLFRKTDEDEGPAVHEDKFLHALPSERLYPLPKLSSPVYDGLAVEVDGLERALVGADDLGDAAHHSVGVISSIAEAAGNQAVGVRSSGVEHTMYLQLEDRTVVRPASFMGSLDTIWRWMSSGRALMLTRCPLE